MRNRFKQNAETNQKIKSAERKIYCDIISDLWSSHFYFILPTSSTANIPGRAYSQGLKAKCRNCQLLQLLRVKSSQSETIRCFSFSPSQ